VDTQDAETAVARALGRSVARQRFRDNLHEIAILFAGALAVIGFATASRQSYYVVTATQIGLPGILYAWLARNGPAGVFLAWMWSAIITYFLIGGYFDYAALVDRTTLTALACLTGAILFLAITKHCPQMLVRTELPFAVLVYCFLVVYSYTAIFQLNCVFDRSSATVHRPVVLEKVYGFRARGLVVDSWSPDSRMSVPSLVLRRGAAMVPPSPELFKATHVGDRICVVQRKGAFAMSWFTTQPDSWTGGPVALGPWGRRF
jgi:hypothetical protein